MAIFDTAWFWLKYYLIPWQIRAYIIWPYQCKRGKHFIATVLTEDMKPDYKWCMHCDTKFDLDFPDQI